MLEDVVVAVDGGCGAGETSTMLEVVVVGVEDLEVRFLFTRHFLPSNYNVLIFHKKNLNFRMRAFPK